MDSSLFFGKNVIVQGITGTQGSFHTKAMVKYGTNIVAGTSTSKVGSTVDGVPVFESIAEIQQKFTVDISIIFVPAKFAKSAILEAITAKIPLIICITEGIPVHDMLYIKQRLSNSSSVLIGPNSPGVLLPNVQNLGIIPTNMSLSGTVGIVSRSGTLTYETMAGLSERGIGQKYIIGIGGDQVRGTGFIECLDLFEGDSEVDKLVLIGEIGGTDETRAGEYIKNHISKPVYGYIAGHSAPVGVQLGHAGAILGDTNESAAAKTSALERVGVITANSIVDLVEKITAKTN